MHNERKTLLISSSVRSEVIIYVEKFLVNRTIEFINLKKKTNKINLDLNEKSYFLLGFPYSFSNSIDSNSLNIKFILFEFWKTYDLKESLYENVTPGLLRSIEKQILLDQIWIKHLQKIALLREIIRWRVYGQEDPLDGYIIESSTIFFETIRKIQDNPPF